MDQLIEGHMRFRREVFPYAARAFGTAGATTAAAGGVHHVRRFTDCSGDETRPGDLFVCRNAGNIRRAAAHRRGACMLNRNTRNRVAMTQAEIMAAYMDDRDDELLDAVVTAAALVTGADGCIEPVERSQLLDFLCRNGLMSVVTSAEMLDFFERRKNGGDPGFSDDELV
jgi:hypothetical protein